MKKQPKKHIVQIIFSLLGKNSFNQNVVMSPLAAITISSLLGMESLKLLRYSA
jgi:hypothetical protein